MNNPKIVLLIALAILVAIGIAGRCDYNESVLYNMSDTTYKAVKTTLKKDCTDTDIVNEYQSNKAYWDSIVQDCSGCVCK